MQLDLAGAEQGSKDVPRRIFTPSIWRLSKLILDGFPLDASGPGRLDHDIERPQGFSQGVVSDLHRGTAPAFADKVERILLARHTIETFNFKKFDSQVGRRMNGDKVKLWEDFLGSNTNNLVARGF
jgi:hypothetical protein